MQNTSTSVKLKRGSKLLGQCDRSAYTELFTAEGRSIILPTTCKTWGCVVCRDKLMGLFKARVEVGVSALGLCAFITITYQAESERWRTAGCVGEDWQELWRRLRRLKKSWQWLKVTELTKKKTPHHHVVIGPIQQMIRCHGPKIRKGRETTAYLKRMDSCGCVSHTFARIWWNITGDSYICFATEVTDPSGAASYMGKYMTKQFLEKERGMTRRFSTSRGWPGGQRIRLRVTLEGGWSHIRRWPGSKFDSTVENNPQETDLLDRVGDNLTIAIRRRNSKRAAEKRFRKVLGK